MLFEAHESDESTGVADLVDQESTEYLESVFQLVRAQH